MLPNIEIFSDTCFFGWGATYNGHSTGGHQIVEESKSRIDGLEMKGASFALKIYYKNMYQVSIYFKIDTTSTIVGNMKVNRQKG